jgi:uncharacterized protein (DUF2141 family)
MKINLAPAAIFLAATALAASGVMSSAGAALAQQTGRVPQPPPTRPGAPATTPPSTASTAPATAPSAPTSRPSAIPMPTQRSSAPNRPQQTTVLLELETLRPEGKIAVAVYRDADSFRHSRNPVRVMMLNRDGPTTRAYIQGLTPGRYVIAAFQDLDSDGELGKGAFGIPREPFGFSNDARGRFGPPTFEDAAFTVSATGTTQRIILRNPMNAILR